jgi:hypothetical protein
VTTLCNTEQGLRQQDREVMCWQREPVGVRVCLLAVVQCHRYCDDIGHLKGWPWKLAWRGTKTNIVNLHNCSQAGCVPWLHFDSPTMNVKPWTMNGFCLTFLRCILIQVHLPGWVRGRKASSSTPGSTFPCHPLNYITWHIFRNLVTVADFQPSHSQREKMLVFLSCEQ